MTHDPTPTPDDPSTGDAAALAAAQWEAALCGQPLPGTPEGLLLAAQAARSALLKTQPTDEPTATDVDRAWQRVLHHAQHRGLQDPEPTFMQRLRTAFAAKPVWAPAMAMLLVGAVGIAVWQGQREPELDVAGLKGGAPVAVQVGDAEASEPRVLGELRGLGLAPRLVRIPAGPMVELQWPDTPTEAQAQWLQAMRLNVPADRRLRLLLVKPAP